METVSVPNELKSSSEIEGSDAETSQLKKWAGLVVLSLALAIIIIDTTLLNVSLSALIRDLNTDILSLQWVITIYALMLAAFTITGGRLGDLFGRKRMFVVGAVIFAIGSFIASISQNVGTMIIGESIIEGIGAALMMPATASLLVANFRGRERAIAFGVWGGIAAASSAIGPLLGGYLTTHFSWRWGFRINIFIAVLLVLGSILIKESRDKAEKPTLDIVGVVLSALGLLSLVFGIIESSKYGWWKAKQAFELWGFSFDSFSVAPIFILLGLFILAAFAFWEKRVVAREQTPLVSPDLFKNRQFSSGITITAILSLAQAGLIFAMPIFFQAVRGFDAFETGLAMLPLSLTMLIAAPLSAVISKYVETKHLVQFGLAMNFVGFLLLRGALSVDATMADFVPGYVMFGIGMGMMMAQINNMTLSAVSVEEAGEASGINNTLRQVGQTLGSAIIGAILLLVLSSSLATRVENSAVIPENAKTQIIEMASKESSNIEFSGGAELVGDAPEAVKKEIGSIVKESTIDANYKALAYGAWFTLFGLWFSMFLPKKKL